MIKAEECRIGNLVGRKYWNPHPTEPYWMIEVETVVEIRMAKVLLEDRHKQRCKFDYDSLEPIPLTEEWLKRFGFERLTGWLDVWRKDGFDRFELTEIHDEYFFNDTKIEFVHQLQNAFFCIEQTELTHD